MEGSEADYAILIPSKYSISSVLYTSYLGFHLEQIPHGLFLLILQKEDIFLWVRLITKIEITSYHNLYLKISSFKVWVSSVFGLWLFNLQKA